MKVFSPILYNTIPGTVDVLVDWNCEFKFEGTDNFDEVMAEEVKVAFLPLFFSRHINIDYKKFDLIVLTEIEFRTHEQIQTWLNETNIENYILAIGGTTVYSPNIIASSFWMSHTVSRNINSLSADITDNKIYDFDVLLGSRRPQRDFIMASLQSSGLLDNSIVTYRENFSHSAEVVHDELSNATLKLLSGQELNFPYISPHYDSSWDTPGINLNNCRDIPWGIYNKTKYSIVAETLVNSGHFFVTEKTTKAFLAKRLFVMFGATGFLKNLRNLGFKTFSDIIDESYDTETDAVVRYQKAFEQVEFLSKQDYNIVCEKIGQIVDHNFNRLFEYLDEVKVQKQTLLLNEIQQLKEKYVTQ